MSADVATVDRRAVGAPQPRWSQRIAASWRPWRQGPTRWVVAAGLAAVAVRLPYLRVPLGSDEGGFLLVGSQWDAGGTSLYGDYWVDRPPLLIAFFALSDRLGGSTALRLLGCLLAFSVVVLAHRLGRHLTPSASPWPVAAAAAFMCMPIFGTRAVDGELIALPFVLLGLLAALRAVAHRPRTRRSLALWAGAGALGAGAAMVKQNYLDVVVFSVALLLATARTRRTARRTDGVAVLGSLALLGGAATVAGMTLLLATTRGTSPLGLWDALVVFRFDAAAVIAHSASTATHDRLLKLLLMMCLSGSVVVIGSFAVHALRRPLRPVAVATLALLGWELIGVLGGGSYWLHYLLGLIPGLVMAVAQLTARPDRTGRVARSAVGYAALVALVTTPAALIVSPPATAAPPPAVWLCDHAQPGDTATVLYGRPNILEAAGLASPYPELWSLPVRVRDHDLAQLRAVLTGSRPPTWLLVRNHLATWGVSAQRAYAVVAARYEPVAKVDGYTVYRLHDTQAPTPAIADAAHRPLRPRADLTSCRARASDEAAPEPAQRTAAAREKPVGVRGGT